MSLFKIVEYKFQQNDCFPYVQINNLSDHLTTYSRFVLNKETDEYMNLLDIDDVNKLILMGADFIHNSKLFEWALERDLIEIMELFFRPRRHRNKCGYTLLCNGDGDVVIICRQVPA